MMQYCAGNVDSRLMLGSILDRQTSISRAIGGITMGLLSGKAGPD
jgi:hypothetical protein